METDDRGFQQWWYGEKKGRNLGLNAVAGKPPEMYNVNPTSYSEMRPGCYDVHERVRDMSAGGTLAGLNFPNWTGFSGQVLNEGPDLAVNEVMIKAYNDWHVDEWCGSYPDRFIACGILPLFDVHKAAEEVVDWRPRDATQSPSRKTHQRSTCRLSTRGTGILSSPRAPTRQRSSASMSGLRPKPPRRRPMRRLPLAWASPPSCPSIRWAICCGRILVAIS